MTFAAVVMIRTLVGHCRTTRLMALLRRFLNHGSKGHLGTLATALIPGVISPRGSKVALIQSLVDYATGKEDVVYPRMFRDFLKVQILAFLPRNCKTKAEAISLFIDLDRTPQGQVTPPATPSQADCTDAGVPCAGPDMQDLVVVPFHAKAEGALGQGMEKAGGAQT